MRIPLSWIDQFTPMPQLTVAEISRRFTLGSCEVEGIQACIDPSLPELWSQVQLVEIQEIEAHPNAKKLSLPTIQTGAAAEQPIRLVCGADNLYLGMKTLWAPAGTEMCSGYDGQNIILKDKEIMGVLSCGMLCSERELGISDEHDGIVDLSELAQNPGISLGMSFAEIVAHCLQPKQALELNGRKISGIEFILDVDNKSLTHRPDMWGLYGIAREFGAIFPQREQGQTLPPNAATTASASSHPIPYGPSPFLSPYNKEWLNQQQALQKPGNRSPITLQIDADSSCLSYCALSLDGIQVGQSPPWMQQRLRLAGVSVINSIVDISNYVMLELGIPNHIFDRNKLHGQKICVYKLKDSQSFQTLDEQQRQLQAGDTVVADESKPQVIAGIMGGQDSSVSSSTRSILLEVAVWDSYEVHKTSMRLGLRSDSSLRYEKSLDPYSIELSLWRLCQLIAEIHPQAQICGELQSYYQASAPQPAEKSELCIETSTAQISRVLGYPLNSDSGRELVCQIFNNLGFRCETDQNYGRSALAHNQTDRQADSQANGPNLGVDCGSIRVYVPSYRTSKDISLEEDLIEEVGRIIGFDNILPQAPLTAIQPTALGTSQQLAREIRNFLVFSGRAQEVLSYPLIGAKLLEQCHWPQTNEKLILANPLNPEQDRMRPSLIPSHLELVERNAHSNRLRQFCIFELGRSYGIAAQPLPPSADEPAKQSTPALQTQEQQHLLVSSYSEKNNPILELRNICEGLLRCLGLCGDWHNHWDRWPESMLPASSPHTANAADGKNRPNTPSSTPSSTPNSQTEAWDGVHPHERLAWYASPSQQNAHYPALTEARIFSIHPALLHQFKLKGKLAMIWIPLGHVALTQQEYRTEYLRPARKKPAVLFQNLQRFPPVEFDCTVVLPAQVLAATAIQALEDGVHKEAKYQRMATLLQKILVRSVYPVPASVESGGSRWLTLQCVFADSNGTLQSQEIKQLEDQTVEILQQAGFPLKMEHAG